MAKDILLSQLQRLTRPLVGLCVRHGIKLGEVIDALKRVYVSCAEQDLLRRGEEVSTSKLSVMTGVHRTDVAALRQEKRFLPRERHIAGDVISQWRYDSRFCKKRGKPRTLEIEGKNSEFADLVKSVTLSVNPYTVSFELERLGMIERTRDGKVRLLSRVFVPKGDPAAILQMLAEDAEDLYAAVDENAFHSGEEKPPHHHLKTEYTNIPSEALPVIRNWLWKEGSALHERARNFISKFDRDVIRKPKSGSGTYRVAIASFSRIEEITSSSLKSKAQGGK